MARKIEDVYTIGDALGSGAFSVVKVGINKKSGERVAIKIINKKTLGKENEVNLQREIDILKKVNHPNIISLLDLFETDKMLYLVMELVTGGELFDRIVEKGSYSEDDARTLIIKILSAIAYLHDLGIAHRDLKPENLLVKSLKDDSEVKLADFGLSKIISQETMMQTTCGTPGYVAPEVLQARGYDLEVDMWSIGVITYILLCGFPPFYNENLPELFEQIMKADYDFPPEYWDQISKDAKDFIQLLLVVEPKKRLSAKAALQHPWLKAEGGVVLARLNEQLSKYTITRKESRAQMAAELKFNH